MAKVLQNPEYLKTQSIGYLLLEFSIPAIIATVVSAGYNLFARVFVGQKLGMIGITALTVSLPPTLFLLAFAMMVGTGATTLISIQLGEQQVDRAEKIIGQSLVLYLFFYVLFLSIGFAFLDPLLRLFGATPDVLPLARVYMFYILVGLFFQEISFGVNSFIRAEGRPIVAMIAMLISVPVNLILLWYFLFQCEMGIAGAGLATVIAQGVSSIWVCWYYLSGRTLLKWRLKYLIPDFKLMRTICFFGTVPLVTQASGAFVHGLQYNVLGYYGSRLGQEVGLVGIDGGVLAVGLMGTIYTIAMMMVMPLLGFSQGIQPLIGYNVGAHRPDRVWKTFNIALIAGTLLATSFWLVALLTPETVLNLFVRQDDPAYHEILHWGVEAVRILLFGLPVVAISILTSGYFQAHGRPVLSLVLSLARQIFFLIPFLILIPWLCDYFHLFSGLTGCWLAFPASDIFAAMVAGLFIAREYTLKKRAIKEMKGNC